MGYGSNLKNILDEKKISVRKLALQVGISPQTLYGAIKRDNALRYDHALRIANALDIDVNLICKNNPFKDTETQVEPQMLSELGGLMTDVNKKSYIKNRTQDLLMLFDYNELPQVDQLISIYYRLDDHTRSELFDMANFLAKKGTDKGRLKRLKTV